MLRAWAILLLACAQVAASVETVRDGDLFSTNKLWRGRTLNFDFGQPKKFASILHVFGDHDFVFQNAPRDYRWKVSDDGTNWTEVASVTNEQRIFRIAPLPKPIQAKFARLEMASTAAVREIQFLSDTNASFPEWFVVLNITDDPKLPGEGKEFIPLARRATGREIPAQQVWLGSFDEQFLAAEPRPLCVFISGSFKDWCEVRRSDFRGLAEVLQNGRIPIWASCGGAQALAIIADAGVDREWDCPHCRDPKNPKTPIYGHIGHTAQKKCGDYSGCIFERGPHQVEVITPDAAFANLDRTFTVIQSHCGQIEYMPSGWNWLIGPGHGTSTKHQAFRRSDRPIYAAQFHIEMPGAPETSEKIMRNFLSIARQWGGYRLDK